MAASSRTFEIPSPRQSGEREGPIAPRWEGEGLVSHWRYPFTLALRELRGGVRGFRVFLACLVLGVGAIAGIGSLGAAVGVAIHNDARVLFGGDASARLVHREASAAEREFLDQSGQVSEIALLQSMAVSSESAL